MTLATEFDRAMFRVYQRALTEVNYSATGFLDMLRKDRGVATAKRLINMPRPSDGYTALYEKNRLDLTVEAQVIDNERWHVLFEAADLTRARRRLEEYKYKFGSAVDPGGGRLPSSTTAESSYDPGDPIGDQSPITRIGDLLAVDAKVWAHPVWGPIGEADRVRAFGKESVARRLEKEGRADRDLILCIGVGTPKRNLPPALTGRILDIATFVPRVMRTEDIIGKERYREWMKQLSGDDAVRWPWGLPVVRAWRLRFRPLSDDVLPGLRQERFVYHHPEAMTTLLSDEERASIADLEIDPVEFKVPIADESGLAAQAAASARVKVWVGRLASNIAARCRGSRSDYVRIRPDFECTETELHLLLTSLMKKQGERCALCGGGLDLSSAPNRLAQPSVDRIDGSVKVYDETNLQITHLACNLGKSDCSNLDAIEFFRSWCGDGVGES